MIKQDGNKRRFGVIQIGIAVLIVALLATGGVLAYQSHSNNKTVSKPSPVKTIAKSAHGQAQKPAPVAVDPTANWTTFTSSKGWQMRVPDGWRLTTDSASSGLTALSDLSFTPGTAAVIEKNSGGRGGPFAFNTATYPAGDPATEKPDYLTEEAVFQAKNVEGRKYSGTLQADVPMEGSKGDTLYMYIFVSQTKSVSFFHRQAAGTPSILPQLEQALASFEFK